MPCLTYVALGGVPAVGKSRCAWHILGVLEVLADTNIREAKLGQARGLVFETDRDRRYLVLGKWTRGDKFPGTDRLSMAVQAEATQMVRAFFAEAVRDGVEAVVLAEGDRLYNDKMFRAVLAMGPAVRLVNVVLRAQPATVAQRHKDRADTQKPTFLKGRATKVARMAEAYADCTHVLAHETADDTAAVGCAFFDIVNAVSSAAAAGDA